MPSTVIDAHRLEIKPFIEVVPTGSGEATLVYNCHRYQKLCLESLKRFILALAGRQSGKTVIGPTWLYNEMGLRGPGDYLIASPTLRLMKMKLLPSFLELFVKHLKLGRYHETDHIFYVNEHGKQVLFGDPDAPETKIFFGYADTPESLESATAKAAWLDEAGQKFFRIGSWEAIQGRLAINQGRILITTTPYDLGGWLKSKLYDPWEAARRNHPLIDVVQFDSIANPAFSVEEYERLRDELPPWKFRLFYQGQFEKPPGMIYECWDREHNTCPPFAIPANWPRYLGLDFGGVHTAGVYLAEEMVEGVSTNRFFAYRQYPETGWHSRTAKQHAEAILEGEPRMPLCVGGSKSEGQWRAEFAAGGLAVREPKISDVEVGINRVYGAIKRRGLIVFDTLDRVLDDLTTYSREVDDLGDPTEKIAEKDTKHFCDAVRYIGGWVEKGAKRDLWVG